MATQVVNYKCPACDGGLKFVGASGKLECEYCGSTFEVAEIEAMYAKADKEASQEFTVEEEEQHFGEWDTSGLEEWESEDGMRAYSCPSCGAELICDETTAATSCPYCGNPTVIPGQFKGGLKPNFVLPFKLDQKAAEAALKNYYKGKKFLPNSFAAENKIKELKGVYVPFWLYDGVADADVSFDATKTRSYRRGDYMITDTEHYKVRRAGNVPFAKVPVDASAKMPDAHMDAIEPFDYSELKEFSTAYLPGYLADKYDVTSEECAKRADERVTNSALSAMRADVNGYDSCSMESHRVNLHRDKVYYGLLPVYMLGTMWEGKQYLFAMNGQTGKLIGDLPVDKGKYFKYFFGITAAVTVVLGTILALVL